MPFQSYLDKYKVASSPQKDGSTLLQFRYADERGMMRIHTLYRGVYLSELDFFVRSVPLSGTQSFNCLSINYCMEGECTVSLGDGCTAVLETGLICIATKQPQRELCSEVARYRGLEFVFDLDAFSLEPPAVFADLDIQIGDMVERLCQRTGVFVAQPPSKVAMALAKLIPTQGMSQSALRMAMLDLLFELNSLTTDSGAICKRWLTSERAAIAKQVYARITSALNRRFTVEQLAAEYGVSPSALKQYFQSVYGEPISVLLKRCRMVKAQELLEHTSLSVASIARQVGYENQSKFSKNFKAFVGCCPMEYRRCMRCGQQTKHSSKSEQFGNRVAAINGDVLSGDIACLR